MRNKILASLFLLLLFPFAGAMAQTLAFPGAQGFGRFATGARGVANPSVYIVTNLNDKGPGSFRDAVSQPGRFVVFAVGGVIRLESQIVVAPNVTIAGQTAPGDGIVLFGKRVTFTGASNSITRFLRIRLGATNNSGQDASGLANGSNMIFDHMSFTWGMDEVFSINWDNKGTAPDNITIQNSIIGQGLHRENHSAGGLIQTPDGGKVSLYRNLYVSNKTRNPKVKGKNEFVNNVVYNWGNAGNTYGHSVSGDAYIMGGSEGVSEVNIINNYFVGGPLTPTSKTTPFSRGTGTFNVYGAGNYFDNNQNGVLDGTEVPFNETGYPGITGDAFKGVPFAYPLANPTQTAEQAFQWILDSVGACYPRRDPVDAQIIGDVASRGTAGIYLYRETDMPLSNGGLGDIYGAPAPQDTDQDGMPDAWEDANGLNKNDPTDAVKPNATYPEYLNIEVYINSLVNEPAPLFLKPPTNVTLSASSVETPAPASTVVINWQDNTDDETGFIIERSEDGVNFTQVTQTAANTTTYTDEGLVPNKTYYYRLKTITATEESAYSSPVSVKTPPVPTAPELPANPSPKNNFGYVSLSGGNATLKWTGSANTTSFAVYTGTSAASLVKVADVPYSASPSYVWSGLANASTYYWRVDATNDKGTTTGEVWSFTTETLFAPGLIGHWSFDDTQGRQITDSSSYENHGVLGLDDEDQSIRVSGRVNGALDFATANTSMYVVSIPNEKQSFLDKGSFSISFWMKAPASALPVGNASAYLLCKGSITRNATTGATGKRFNVEFKSQQIRFAIDDDNDSNGGGKDELQASATDLFTNEWVHVTVVRDTTEKKLKYYRNGVLVKDQTITKALSGIGEESALIIGNIGELEFLANTNQPAPYKGSLDELKFFNYALTAQEIADEYNSAPPLTAEPVAAANPYPLVNAQVTGSQVNLSWTAGDYTESFKLYAGTDAGALSLVADLPATTTSYSYNITSGNTYYWRVDAVNSFGTTTGTVWSFNAVGAANPAPTNGLVGYWSFDKADGTSLTDQTSYANAGTLHTTNPAARIEGKRRKALDFSAGDPTTYMVSIPHKDHLAFNQESFSISLWMKADPSQMPTGSAVGMYLFCKGSITKNATTGATGNRINIELKSSQLRFNIDNDAAGKDEMSVDATPFFTGDWVHLVAIYNSVDKKLSVYRNGEFVKEQTATKAHVGFGEPSSIILGNIGELEFQDPERKNASAPYLGSLDELKIFNRVLTVQEIQDEFNLPAPSTGKAYAPVPADGATVNKKKVPLSWGAADGVTGYNVYIGEAPGAMTLAATLPASETSYTATLEYNKTYYWRVDAEGGEAGDVWSFTTNNQFPTGLVGYWSFDEPSGSQLVDSTSYQNHGVITLNDPGIARISNGYSKNALDFANAESDKAMALIPDDGPISFTNGSFTFAFWMKGDISMLPPDNNSSAYLLCKGSITRDATVGSTGNRINIELKNKQIRFNIDDDSKGKDEMQMDGTPFFTGEWVHVVAMYDAAERKLRLYRNAELVKEQTVSKAYGNFGEESALVLGNIGELELQRAAATPAPYRGMLDELKIFNYALPYVEVAKEYFGGTTPQKPHTPSYNNTTVDGYGDMLKLTWVGGANTDKYNVYLGNTPETMTLVKEIPVNDPAEYTIAFPPANTSYFWRVDAVGQLETVTGDQWSFTTVMPKGLVAHYTFDTHENGVMIDSSEYANHGLLRNATESVFDVAKIGDGINLTGASADAAVVVPSRPQIHFDATPFTASLWVNVPAYDAANTINAFLFHKGDVENATGKWYGLKIEDRNLIFSVCDGTNTVSASLNIASNGNASRNVFGKGWTNIIVQRRPAVDRLQIYINGTLALSHQIPNTNYGRSVGNDANLLIGNSIGNRPIPVAIDDVRFYNYELTTGEITRVATLLPLLSKPINPFPTEASVGANPEQLELTWEEPSALADSFNVYFGADPEALELIGEGVKEKSISVDTLTPLQTYYWRVQSLSKSNGSATSSLWSFVTGADTKAPTVITKNISVELNTSGEATLDPASLDDGSHDEYGIAEFSASKTTFSCDDLGENTITLSVTDNNGNVGTATAVVTVVGDKPAKPSINAVNGTEICFGDRFELNTEGVDLATTYRWVYQSPTETTVTTSAEKRLLSYKEGTYKLIARSAQTCNSDTSDAVIIRYSADTTLQIENSSYSIQRGQSVTLRASGSAGTITWFPQIGAISTDANSITVAPVSTTRYTAKLTTPIGCKVERSTVVNVGETFETAYNQLLTPNGDGVNDRLVFKNLTGFPNNKLQIFDAGGKMIYQKVGYSNDWDGRLNGKPVVKGTYFFMLYINDELKMKGSITVIP